MDKPVEMYAVIISDATRGKGESWLKVYNDGWVRVYPSENLYETSGTKDQVVQRILEGLADQHPEVHYAPKFDKTSDLTKTLLDWYASFMPIPVVGFVTEAKA